MLKTIIFFLFAPLVYSLIGIVLLTYGDIDKSEGWYQKMCRSDKYFEILLAVLATPFVMIPVYSLRFFYSFWDNLLDT
jgi:hypothetical protein